MKKLLRSVILSAVCFVGALVIAPFAKTTAHAEESLPSVKWDVCWYYSDGAPTGDVYLRAQVKGIMSDTIQYEDNAYMTAYVDHDKLAFSYSFHSFDAKDVITNNSQETSSLPLKYNFSSLGMINETSLSLAPGSRLWKFTDTSAQQGISMNLDQLAIQEMRQGGCILLAMRWEDNRDADALFFLDASDFQFMKLYQQLEACGWYIDPNSGNF